jgi:hypothetical protein
MLIINFLFIYFLSLHLIFPSLPFDLVHLSKRFWQKG